jgi:hypothetical protein
VSIGLGSILLTLDADHLLRLFDALRRAFDGAQGTQRSPPSGVNSALWRGIQVREQCRSFERETYLRERATEFSAPTE